MPVKRFDKTPMPVREAEARAHDFVEVNSGYSASRAVFEADRCLRCQHPFCEDGCPVRIPIPDFIHAISSGDMRKAATILRTANPLPAICGRVCPQESQCEALCSLTTRTSRDPRRSPSSDPGPPALSVPASWRDAAIR
jgi:glutamate synthase (NADPH/NADH) small chain